MCGITGVLSFQKSIDVLAYQNMPHQLLHRGPEHTGIWHNEQIFLAQTRLKILDLSPNANQPLFNEDESIAAVINGEIYNFKDLRAKLLQKNHVFRSQGDSEVILHLYEEEGIDFLNQLEGMFALAIWDTKNQKLILAKDRTGKKPLFYTQNENLFAFASEIKAFFPVKDIPIEKNESLFPYYFLYGYIPTPHTFYKNIFSLEPGHALMIQHNGKNQKIQYWNPAPYYSQKKKKISKKEAIENVRTLVQNAVEKRLLSDVPLGCFLSGGIDSTIITGIASQQVRHPLQTFSIGFEGDKTYDETAYAKLAAQKFKTQHTEFHLTPNALIEQFDRLLYHYDGPFGDSSCLPTSIVSQLAKEHVTVVLTGDGGDEVFGGYNRFVYSRLLEYIPKGVPHLLDPLISFGLNTWKHPAYETQKWKRFLKACNLPFLERLIRWESIFYEDLPHLLTQNFTTSLSTDFHYQPFQKDLNPMTKLSKMLFLNLKTYLLNDLNIKMDRASMMNALETRAPFLDHALIEYAATLPDSFKIRGLKTKVILKEAFQDLLPPEIQNRPKAGFGVPIDKWFRRELKSWIQDEFSNLEAVKPYLNTTYIQNLLQEHLREKNNHGQKIWSLLMFKKWMEQ